MKIFLAGAVSSADESQLKKYVLYKKVLTEMFNDVSLTTPDDIWDYRNECIRNNPALSKNDIDDMMVDFDLKKVRESDLIICDLSEVSTGMGIELGVVHENKKNIIFFYEEGSHVSNMVTGAFKKACFVQYNGIADLQNKLKIELTNL